MNRKNEETNLNNMNTSTAASESKSDSMIKSPVKMKRSNLADVIPLDTPYMLFIDPCNACNFKCDFCAPQAAENKPLYKRMCMDMNLYKQIIDGVAKFPRPLKILRLYTMGEPLIHPDFPEMVSYAKSKGISEYIETVTNGSLLNPDLNQKLADCGIDRIRISIEGIDSETYQKVCNANLKMEALVENIKDLYMKTRGKVEIYVKTVDVSVDTAEKKEKFYQMFEHISDKMFIENIGPIWPDFDELDEKYDYSGQKLMGGMMKDCLKCCPVIFYGMVVNPDGDVTPCCADWERGYIYGNAMETPINEIWGNEKMKFFWKEMLKGNRSRFGSCRKCKYLNYVVNDDIDDAADIILRRIEACSPLTAKFS